MRYPIAIEPRTEESAYGVVVPDLPGCFSAGETLEEAIAAAEEAGLAWIDATLDAGDAVPMPSSLEAIRANPQYAGWILSVVTIDPAALDDTVASTSRFQDASCGGSTTMPRRPARHDRGILPSWRSAGEENAHQNLTGSPIEGAVNSPSHITRRPRTKVPTGQPVTVLPS
jgi:predicted RNase H-like HicB family nuclease